jgi:peptide/nickel transport system substrate-binding protein
MIRSLATRRTVIGSLVLVLGVGFVFATGLAGAAVRLDAGGVKDGGAIVIGIGSLDFIDPTLAVPFNGGSTPVALAWRSLTEATCALLFRYPVGAPPVVRYNLVPEVAARYPALSSDGRTYTFTIRSGFKFSTGAPVTAASYAAAINRNLNPVMRSPAAQYLMDVVGADAVEQGRAQTASGVKVAGNRLIVALKRRVFDFPDRMTMANFCPVPAGLPVDPEGARAPLPGSGPYYYAEFVRGSRAVLERNPFYRGPRVHHVDRITLRIGDDRVLNTSKVEADEVDVDLAPPNQKLAELEAKYGVNKSQLFSVSGPTVFYIYMNTEGALFRNNPKLRQAVNFAIDRTALLGDVGPTVKAGTSLVGTTADSYLPPGIPGTRDVHPYPLRHPNLEKARALARGHTRSGKAVWYACNDVNLACIKIAETVKDNLKAIGIDVEINATMPYTVKAAKTATRGEPFDLADDLFGVPWVDAAQYVRPLLDGRTIRPSGNTDLSYFNSAHYNALIDRAEKLSRRARSEAYGKIAADVAANAAPMAVMWMLNIRFLVSSRVGCITVGPHGLELAGLCLK